MLDNTIAKYQRMRGTWFGNLVFVGPVRPRKGTSPDLYCMCTCGSIRWYLYCNLAYGKSRKCRDCAVNAFNAATTALKFKAAKNKYDKYKKCGHNVELINGTCIFMCSCGKRKNMRSKRCQSCTNSLPKKYPVSVSVVARIVGISKQAAYQSVQRHGFDGMLKLYKLTLEKIKEATTQGEKNDQCS